MALTMTHGIGYKTGSVNGHVTGCAETARRSFYRPMLKDVLSRIEQRLKALGISATAASKAAGLSEDAIRNMRRAVEKDERQGVSTATIMALAPVLQTSAAWLIEGAGAETEELVPIVGHVGADNEGTVFYSTGQSAGDMAPPPPGGAAGAAALEVRGHSMRGLADDGSLIYFAVQRPPGSDLLGAVCVVETIDGRVLVKRLLKGDGPGVFDLESLIGPTLENVELRWAAELTAIRPPREARRIIRRAGERQVA